MDEVWMEMEYVDKGEDRKKGRQRERERERERKCHKNEKEKNQEHLDVFVYNLLIM
jgi:hypothetical protein